MKPLPYKRCFSRKAMILMSYETAAYCDGKFKFTYTYPSGRTINLRITPEKHAPNRQGYVMTDGKFRSTVVIP